jgi:N-acyl-D-amino-acid deacylase
MYAEDAMLDLLIRGGRMIDGTGSSWSAADLAVKDGRIVAIGRLGAVEARCCLDLPGRFVTPGFIDLHTHSDLTLLVDGDARSTLAQGVTTQLIGNCGVSAAPAPDRRIYYGPLDPGMTRGLECDWVDLAGYLRRLEAQGTGTNVAALVGHGNIRVAAMGYADRAPTPAELRAMQGLVAQAMEQGAYGLSSGLAYAPGPYASVEELTELARVAGRYGGIYTSHIRNQTEGIAASVEEVIAVGERAALPVHVSHLQPGSPMLGATGDLLRRLEAARTRGVEVGCDAIPYTIGSTTLKSLLPPWACEGGDEALLARLRDPRERERIREDTMVHGAESGGSRKRNLAKEGRWDLIWLGSTERHPELVGRSFAEIGKARGQDPHEAVLDLLLEEEGRPWMLAQDVSEEDFRNVAGHPLGGVISDGFSLAPEGVLATGRQHPRSFAAFPYFLRRFVREQGAFGWEHAVHKLTGYPAGRLGLQDRGLLREGMWADLCVFDPQAIADTADFDQPYQYPRGIDYVLVNGQVAVEQGRVVGRRAGRVLCPRPSALF